MTVRWRCGREYWPIILKGARTMRAETKQMLMIFIGIVAAIYVLVLPWFLAVVSR